MDMSGMHDHDGSSGSAASGGHMNMVFHWAIGDTLWFPGWVPQSAGAVAGTAIGLFLLAILERWTAAMRIVMEAWWKQKTEAIVSRQFTRLPELPTVHKHEDETLESAEHQPPIAPRTITPRVAAIRTSAPFILSHDVSRGILQAVQSAMQYALMLAVMTFQASYFIAIVLGAGVGEFLFGRYGRGAAMH